MSLTEQQIKQIVREEVRRIFDAGLLYTETCKPVEKQGTTQAPLKPQTATAPMPSTSPSFTILEKFSQDLAEQLTAEKIGNKWIVKPLHFLNTDVFYDVCKEAKELQGIYLKEPKNNHWEIPA